MLHPPHGHDLLRGAHAELPRVLAIILAGVPAFLYWNRRKRADAV